MPWEMQAGDPLDFAFKLAFTRNPHGGEDRSTIEDRESWGYFAVWVDGENLCAHREQDELLQGAHWYMLPLLEWITSSWDALLHEERLPLRNIGDSAAAAMVVTKLPPLSLKEVDEFDWMDAWAQWWERHNLRAAREGGLLPDVYIRRYRDQLEISTGSEELPGIPTDTSFVWKNRTYRVSVDTVAHCLYEVLTSAVAELERRLPDSTRVSALRVRLDSLNEHSRRTDRLAWLGGLGDRMEEFRVVSDAVNEALDGVDEHVRSALVRRDRDTPLVVLGTPFARLLYGALSPDIDTSDVAKLTSALVDNYVQDAGAWLSRLEAVTLDVDEVRQLPPGEQGSRLGEAACDQIGKSQAGRPLAVDVESVLVDLDVATSSMLLSDENLRAVSVLGPSQRPHIYVNGNFARGGREPNLPVRRSTLAHELCHLLLDKERGDELAVASGPWAPVAVEQRANAFAAAFLMPSWLLREAIAGVDGPLDDIRTISSVAASLQVSSSSLVDRLFNLGELTSDDRIRLRTVAQRRLRAALPRRQQRLS